jgi:hypothetical protein
MREPMIRLLSETPFKQAPRAQARDPHGARRPRQT